MTTIWKYRFPWPPGAVHGLVMPEGAIIRHWEPMADCFFLWAEVDPNRDTVERRFCVLGTGWDIPEGYHYLRTVMQPPYVWHIFEVRD